MAQRKGEASKHLKAFQKMVYAHLQNRNGSSRAAEGGGGKRFMGGIVKKNHGTNETAAGWTIGVNVCEAGTLMWRPGLISQTSAGVFVSARLARSLAPPACKVQAANS